jgi:SPP1 gp7 family putative phage head morphogenesis protein
LITGFPAGVPDLLPSLIQLLDAYADALKPWARATATRMIMDVDGQDRASWRALGNAISAQLRNDILNTPVGEIMRSRLDEQVTLITSLPIEAGKRVHELTLKGLDDSRRYQEVAEEIGRSGEVTESRAILIARTETSRTASGLDEARATYNGFPDYIWHTAEDGDVRPGHQEMDGKVCQWASPPAVNENGRIMHFHPGCIWNCRCWAEPIIH